MGKLIQIEGWTKGHGKHGRMITLWFFVPMLARRHFIACYYPDVSEQKARRECRDAAEDWAQKGIAARDRGAAIERAAALQKARAATKLPPAEARKALAEWAARGGK